MKAVVCDKCGRTVTDLDSVTEVSLSSFSVGSYDTKHLCGHCEDAFYEWLESGEDGGLT